MKLKSFFIAILGVLFFAVAGNVYAADELPSGEHFGDGFTNAPLVSVLQMTATPDKYYRTKVRTTGTIERQCPASGCWFYIKDAKGAEIRVELSDYFLKLPTNVGKSTMVEGEIVKFGENHIFVADRVTFFDKPYMPEGVAAGVKTEPMDTMQDHDMSMHEMSSDMDGKDMEDCH